MDVDTKANNIPGPGQADTGKNGCVYKTVQFIEDEEAQADSFGAHDRVAGFLAQAVEKKAPPKIIGLLGPWGSGKSTVVRFLKRQLRKDTYVFTYDAWLHQGDAPRRSFLEEFLRSRLPPGVTANSEWDELLGRLTGKVEVTDTSESPVLTPIAGWTLLAAGLVPFGTTLLLRAKEIATAFDLAERSAVLIWCGVFLVLLPLIIVGGAILGRDRSTSVNGLVSLFINRKGERTRKHVVKDPVPSSVEFRDLFTDIVAKIQAGAPLFTPTVEDKQEGRVDETTYQRVVIVIDNLDRLPTDEAREVWTVVRGFFYGSLDPVGKRQIKGATLPPITTIVALDEASIARIHGGKEADVTLAEGFTEKMFSLTVRIPAPRLEDWHAYFRERLRHALAGGQAGTVAPATNDAALGEIPAPAVPERDMVTATRIVDAHLHEAGADITPRRINVIVNRIAVMWAQWGHELKLIPILHYAVNQRKIDSNILSHLDSKPAIDAYFPGWEASICAMHFGVPKAQAMEVLMGAPLRALFSSAPEQTAFNQLATIPGFEATMDRIVSERSLDKRLQYGQILTAAHLLAGLPDGMGLRFSSSWNELEHALRDAPRDRELNVDDAISLDSILMTNPQRSASIVERFLSLLIGSTTGDAQLSLAVRTLGLLRTSIVDAATVSRPIALPFDAYACVAIMARLSDHTDLVSQLRGTHDGAIRDALMTMIADDRPLPLDVKGIFAVVGSAIRVDWSETVDQIAMHMQTGPSRTRQEATILMAALTARTPRAKQALEQRASDGRLAAVINSAISSNDYMSANAAICELLVEEPAAWPPVKAHTATLLASSVNAGKALYPIASRLVEGGMLTRRLLDAAFLQKWFAPMAGALLVQQLAAPGLTQTQCVEIRAAATPPNETFDKVLRDEILAQCDAYQEFGIFQTDPDSPEAA